MHEAASRGNAVACLAGPDLYIQYALLGVSALGERLSGCLLHVGTANRWTLHLKIWKQQRWAGNWEWLPFPLMSGKQFGSKPSVSVPADTQFQQAFRVSHRSQIFLLKLFSFFILPSCFVSPGDQVASSGQSKGNSRTEWRLHMLLHGERRLLTAASIINLSVWWSTVQ